MYFLLRYIYFPTAGTAILVTCDYEKSDLSTLSGTAEDGRQMRQTFNAFGYVVHQLHNPTKDEIIALIKKVSESMGARKIDEKEGKESVVIFYFSGHGCSDDRIEKLYANDGKTLDFKDEIVFPLTRQEAAIHVPKIFFIDACRGGENLMAKVMSESSINETMSGTSYAQGIQHVEGNIYIAYATIPHHVSRTDSMWMQMLARALRETNDPLLIVVGKVMHQVNHLKKEQQCEAVYRQTEHLSILSPLILNTLVF